MSPKRSIDPSVVSVFESRMTSSFSEMMPRRWAATALHMYAPIFVVDVCTLRLPWLVRTSAGRPERPSVIATKDAHVRFAYWSI